jgi:mono/diheme cytochrome c family protein
MSLHERFPLYPGDIGTRPIGCAAGWGFTIDWSKRPTLYYHLQEELGSQMTKKILTTTVGVILAACTLAAADKKGDAAKGKELFEQCGVCHNADSDEKKMGPGLKGLFKKAKLANGKAVNDENVKAILNSGGNGMPAYESILSDDEKAHVMAYLKTL